MTKTSRMFCYAVLAIGLMASSAPAFATGDGGNPSSTTGSADLTAPNPNRSPAGSSSNPRRATTTTHRKTAQNTSTHTSATPYTGGVGTSAIGAGTAGTPNSHPAMAPSAAVQTNNPDGGGSK